MGDSIEKAVARLELVGELTGQVYAAFQAGKQDLVGRAILEALVECQPGRQSDESLDAYLERATADFIAGVEWRARDIPKHG